MRYRTNIIASSIINATRVQGALTFRARKFVWIEIPIRVKLPPTPSSPRGVLPRSFLRKSESRTCILISRSDEWWVEARSNRAARNVKSTMNIDGEYIRNNATADVSLGARCRVAPWILPRVKHRIGRVVEL